MSDSKLFVYGTLKPGDVRWPVLAPFVAGEPIPASIDGTLVDPGYGWPALVLESGTVTGYLVKLAEDSREEAWRTLDAVEGADLADPLFRRISLSVTYSRDEQTCTATGYLYCGEIQGLPRLGGAW